MLGGDSLLEVYRLLKYVGASDEDELTRVHALACLGELDRIMKAFVFPPSSLTKKITVLDHIQ